MINLGQMERIKDLRTVWAHEALDFTKWLGKEENLRLLSQSVGIDISLEEMESAVGGFSVDIFATEETTGRKIIIENQLEDTDHDHLGKVITYASGKNAEVIIWIVKRARDEHRQAVEWLNQHTDENIGFFLLEIELWKIDESKPAVKFNVVERPNDWAKTMKNKEGLTETKQSQLEYWQSFSDYANNEDMFTRELSVTKPLPQSWYNLSVGTSKYNLVLRVGYQKKKISAEIYINEDKEIFEHFKQYSEKLEETMGIKLEFIEANKICRIVCTKDFDVKNKSDQWEKCHEWHCEMALKLKEVCKKYGV